MKQIKKVLKKILSICLIAIISGCTQKVEKEYIIQSHEFVDCPFPKSVTLPLLDNEQTLNSDYNLLVLGEREKILRAYITSLKEALICFSKNKGE